MVKVVIGESMKLRGGFFVENDRVDVLDIFIAESFLFFTALSAHSLVLPKEQIGRVAGAALSGKHISQSLDFKVGNASIIQFDHNVCNDQITFAGDPCGVIRQDRPDLYRLMKEKR